MKTKFLVTEHASFIRHLLDRMTTDDHLYYKQDIEELKLALGANVPDFAAKEPVGHALTSALELHYPGVFNGDSADAGTAVAEISAVLAGMFLLIAKLHGRETAEKAQLIMIRIIAKKMKSLDDRVNTLKGNPPTSQSSH